MPTSSFLRRAAASTKVPAKAPTTAIRARVSMRSVALGALASGLLLTASPAMATAAPGSVRPVDPPAPVCAGPTRAATLPITATGEKESYWTHVSPDGSLHSDRWAQLREPTNIGAPQITLTTCADAAGRWRLHSFTTANRLPDLTSKALPGGRVRVDPRVGAYGWGVFTRGIKGSTLTLEVARCVRAPQTAADHGVAQGFPGLPTGGKGSYPVGSWIADTPLPAAAKGSPKGASTCGDMGRVTIPLTVSSTGVPSVARATRGVANAHWVTGPVCPPADSTCSQNVREIVTVLARP